MKTLLSCRKFIIALLFFSLRPKCVVLGHSMAGMVATRFTLMYPDKVEKSILEDPIGLEDWKLK